MEFKNLPLKLQLVLALMHSIGILETMCEQQGLSQEVFEKVVHDSFAAGGIDPNYIRELSDSLTEQENALLADYLALSGEEDAE